MCLDGRLQLPTLEPVDCEALLATGLGRQPAVEEDADGSNGDEKIERLQRRRRWRRGCVVGQEQLRPKGLMQRASGSEECRAHGTSNEATDARFLERERVACWVEDGQIEQKPANQKGNVREHVMCVFEDIDCAYGEGGGLGGAGGSGHGLGGVGGSAGGSGCRGGSLCIRESNRECKGRRFRARTELVTTMQNASGVDPTVAGMLFVDALASRKCCGQFKVCLKTVTEINPVTQKLFAKCLPCREKHRKTSYSKRKRDQTDQKTAVEAGNVPETWICMDCGRKPTANFDVHEETGVPKTYCRVCMPKMIARIAVCKKTDKGKATQKKYKDSDKGKAANERYDKSDKGKAVQKKYHDSDKGKAAQKKYDKSDKGKAANERYNEGRRESFALRRTVQPAWALKEDLILNAANFVAHRKFSFVFEEKTGLLGKDLLARLKETFHSGMTFANYAEVWQISHLIPRAAFDHNDPENVRRCWDVRNFRADLIKTNQEMQHRIIPENALLAGPECFPVEWNDHVPSQNKIDGFFDWCTTKWQDKTEWFDWSTEGAGSSAEHAYEGGGGDGGGGEGGGGDGL